MSLEGFRPISNDKLGSLLSRLHPESVPYQMSPLAMNVRYKAKGVQTRNGLSKTGQLPSIDGIGDLWVRGGGVLALPNTSLQIPLFYGSNATAGELFKESPCGSGLFTVIASAGSSDEYMDITFAYGRAFMAFSNLVQGSVGAPRMYDGTYFTSVQVTPNTTQTTNTTSGLAGVVDAGTRYSIVLYLDRWGYITQAIEAAITSYTAADSVHMLHMDNIPVSGDTNVVRRVVAFTTAGGDSTGPYYYIPANDTVNGISITGTVIGASGSGPVDFNFFDTYLQGSSNISSPVDFFDKINLPRQVSVYFSPTNRRLVWAGGEDDATIFRLSEPDDPQTYLGSTGFIKPSQNDGERAICAREFRSQLYLFKETAGFLAYNDAVDPSDWTVEKRWDKVGPVGPWAVDVSESFMIFIDQSGVYLMDGSEPHCISDEISSVDSNLWSRINFSVKQKFWVLIDTDLDEIHCGVALDGQTEVSTILKCNYLLGLKPGLRRWSVDNIPSTKMIKALRTLPASPNPAIQVDPRIATSQYLHLSSNADGMINLVDPASYSDNGNGIDSRYQTGYHEEEGMMQIGGIGVNVKGAGQLQVSILKDQATKTVLSHLLPENDELMAKVIKATGVSPWWSVQFDNNNQPGNWFDISRCDLYVRTMFKTRRTRS